jgi:hypothetical protein
VFKPKTKLTSYELWNNKKSTVKYFIVFKSDKEILLGYSSHIKAYNVYNLQTQTSMESINVVVDDNLKEFVKEDLGNIH